MLVSMIPLVAVALVAAMLTGPPSFDVPPGSNRVCGGISY